MTAQKPFKKLAILDLDNTMVDTLDLWGESLSELISNFKDTYDVDVDIIHTLIREAPGQYRFNDGVSLAKWMIETDPRIQTRHMSLMDAWEKAGVNPIAHNWLNNSAARTVFYPGVLEMLKDWQQSGTRVVIQTDAEECAVTRRLWWLAKNATAAGELQSPYEILDLVDHIYCQPHIIFDGDFMHDVEFRFVKALDQKMTRWDDRLYKPESSHIRRILDDADVPAAQAVYVGDTHKDGIEAKSIAGVDFAWSQYGTGWSPKTAALYAEVGSKSYSYGVDVIKREMQNRGVAPDATLEQSFSELNDHYVWAPK